MELIYTFNLSPKLPDFFGSSFLTNKISEEICHSTKCSWNLFNKADCCRSFPAKQTVVKIFQQSKLLWKFSSKANLCGNYHPRQIFMEIFQQQKKFFFFKFLLCKFL